MTTVALTIPELKADDRGFEDFTISRVVRYDDGYDLGCGSMGLCLQDRHNRNGVEPKPGDTLRVYGSLGRPFYGMDLNGKEVYWLTPLEREAERAAMLARFDRESRERYEKDRAANDEAIANMSEPLRKRMERFRAEDKDGKGRLSEAYEIFACTEADKIADVLRPKLANMTAREAVEWFRALPYAEQTNLGLSDQHSGNTFGGACSLALALLEGRDV